MPAFWTQYSRPNIQYQRSKYQKRRPMSRPWCASRVEFPAQRPHRYDLPQGQQAFGRGDEGR